MTTLGRWTLIEIIGRGAAGTVWSVTDGKRIVTAKVADADDARARRSLDRERRILGRLAHPNLPTLLHAFDDPPSLVMDTPPTKTYGDLLSTGMLWTISLRQRLDTLSTVAQALDHLHAQGIVHRDVKPTHVASMPTPLLFDFGIAMAGDDEDPPDDDAGTAAYMPPPDEPVGPARDAYAFAITTYELLFGAHPLLTAADRDASSETLRRNSAAKVQDGTWRKPSHIPRPELPPDLRDAELAALDALFAAGFGEPDGRPASLAGWIEAVRSHIVLDDSATAAPDVMPESAFVPTHTAHEVAAALQTDDNPAKAGGWPKHVIAAAAIVIAAIVLLLLRQ